MDPTETFNAMMEFFALGMHDEAAEQANALALWLERDGFPPTLRIGSVGTAKSSFIVTDQLASKFCFAACRVILDQSETGDNVDFFIGETIVFQSRGSDVSGRIVEIDPDIPVAVVQLVPSNAFVTIELVHLRKPKNETMEHTPNSPEIS